MVTSKPLFSAPSLLRLLAALALMAAVSAVGGLVTTPEIPGWYAGLNKPSWTPPNAVFPIAWTTLYILMAIVLWRLWALAPPSRERTLALRLFLIQLALNAVWSPIFFGLHAIVPGLVVVMLLALVLIATIRVAFKVDALAGWLLLPYLAWICYASSLNAAIAATN